MALNQPRAEKIFLVMQSLSRDKSRHRDNSPHLDIFRCDVSVSDSRKSVAFKGIPNLLYGYQNSMPRTKL